MDKNIEKEVGVRKKKRMIYTVLIVGSIFLASIFFLRYSLAATLHSSEITTSIVEKGDIENTINASGEILPEFEEVVTSSIEATLQEVLIDVGSKIKSGQSILALDKSLAKTQYEKSKFQLESKENEILKLKLELDKSYFDIKSNDAIKQLTINSLEANVENAKKLHKAGGGTLEDVKEAELKLKVAILEKQRLENEILSKRKTMTVQRKEAEIAASIQKSDLMELGRKLQLGNVLARRSGIVTWVNKNIGANVVAGEPLARISDLSSFKIGGRISDTYVDQLYVGMPAIIKINQTTMRGKVNNISPSIQNNIIAFDVQLEHKNHKLFRPNMKVDVFLVTESRQKVLRVLNGPAFKDGITQDVFVVKDGKAIRRTVQTGLTSFDHIELKGPVKPGDVVITSDMSEFKNTKEITIED
ncbi:MAG TPA: HlyD family efflux transporter periplasmic adaptor subunit [Cytophagaceae bacterium]|jgi:HlyD family secretion protein